MISEIHNISVSYKILHVIIKSRAEVVVEIKGVKLKFSLLFRFCFVIGMFVSDETWEFPLALKALKNNSICLLHLWLFLFQETLKVM